VNEEVVDDEYDRRDRDKHPYGPKNLSAHSSPASLLLLIHPALLLLYRRSMGHRTD
jgi:hypothetical protein